MFISSPLVILSSSRNGDMTIARKIITNTNTGSRYKRHGRKRQENSKRKKKNRRRILSIDNIRRFLKAITPLPQPSTKEEQEQDDATTTTTVSDLRFHTAIRMAYNLDQVTRRYLNSVDRDKVPDVLDLECNPRIFPLRWQYARIVESLKYRMNL